MVTSSFLPGRGGIESYLAELCTVVAPRLAVVAAGSRDGRPIPLGLPYRTFVGPGSMLVPGKAVVEATVEAARSCETERVLFGTPWPLALIGPRLKKEGLRYSVIVHASEMLVPAALPVVSARLADALAQADVLFAVSDFTAGEIERVLARKKRRVPPIERLRARVDLDRYRPQTDTSAIRERIGVRPQERIVLCFGRLVRRKGVHRLLALADELARSVEDLVIVVAGTGPEEKRLRRAAGAVRTKVIFTGRVSEDDAPALYATAAVFALPVVDRYFGLETEGLGVVLLEAAACGRPCVTGRSGGTPEAVIDGRTGFVVDARQESELITALARLLADPGLAETMGAAGREHVANNFSAEEPPRALLDWLGG